MITMHAIMHDRNQRSGLFFDVLQLLFSTILVSMVFVDPEILSLVKLSTHETSLILGISVIITFFISLVILRVNWKEKSARHGHARDILSRLKFECREILNSNKKDNQQVVKEFFKTYSISITDLIKIPESKFNKLKAAHKRKIEFSKFLDQHPKPPYLISRFLFLIESLKK